MEELTRFGMKNSLTLQSLANTYFNRLREKKYEAIYIYNDEYMLHFVRQIKKGGLSLSRNQ